MQIDAWPGLQNIFLCPVARILETVPFWETINEMPPPHSLPFPSPSWASYALIFWFHTLFGLFLSEYHDKSDTLSITAIWFWKRKTRQIDTPVSKTDPCIQLNKRTKWFYRLFIRFEWWLMFLFPYKKIPSGFLCPLELVCVRVLFVFHSEHKDAYNVFSFWRFVPAGDDCLIFYKSQIVNSHRIHLNDVHYGWRNIFTLCPYNVQKCISIRPPWLEESFDFIPLERVRMYLNQSTMADG